ncbi:hypothetical protein [Geothermobacter hydrogeniphilus]|uniref:hypothetical protein n=1 Tax=Geothermobacter hydrogeniphilus TaxID=1969733 RepID=UPI00111C3983|nr:hypothetical protein [Geothermobacter hydrogeniphilus]
MKNYHVKIHDHETNEIFEANVLASNDGEARTKARNHFIKTKGGEVKFDIISSIEMRLGSVPNAQIIE